MVVVGAAVVVVGAAVVAGGHEISEQGVPPVQLIFPLRELQLASLDTTQT